MSIKNINIIFLGSIFLLGFFAYPLYFLFINTIKTQSYYLREVKDNLSICRDFKANPAQDIELLLKKTDLYSSLTPIDMTDLNLEGDFGDLLRIEGTYTNFPHKQEQTFIYRSKCEVEETNEKLKKISDLISANNSGHLSFSNSNFPGNTVSLKYKEKLPYCESELAIRQMNILNEEQEYEAIVIIAYEYERKPKLFKFSDSLMW